MKKLIISFMIIGIVITTFHACKKNSQDEINNASNSPSKHFPSNRSNLSYSNNRSLTDTDILIIAETHNSYLDSALRKINWKASDLKKEADLTFSSFYNSEWPLSHQQFTSLFNQGGLDSTRINSSFQNTSAFYTIYYGVLGIVADSLNNYSKISSLIDDMEAIAKSDLTGSDIDLTLIFLETTKKSAYIWLPVNRGGSGVGYNYILDYCKSNGKDINNFAPTMAGVLGADGLGAVYGWLAIALIIAPTPVTLGAIVAVVGIEAAHESIAYIVLALMF